MLLSPRPLILLCLAVACVSRDEPARDTARDAAATPPATPPVAPLVVTDSAASSRWVVSPKGYGPVVAGMPLAALSSALGEPLRATNEAGSGCGYVRPAALPKDVLVMVVNDTVARVDVRARTVLTGEGVGVGDTEAKVLERYAGRVRTTPHKYTGPTGHYLTVSAPPDSTHLIVFETDGRAVVNYRAGRRPAVELVEGCS